MSAARRILVVNDDDDALTLLRHALQREFPGVTLLEFNEADQALAVLRKESVDAIVTDYRMPRISGVEFVRQLRRWDHHTPIIMLTGSDETRADAREAGVTTFIGSGSWVEIVREIRGTLEQCGFGDGRGRAEID